MFPLEDLTGRRFGRLVCVRMVPRETVKRVTWFAQCDCGNAKQATARDLKCGDVRSCGCLRMEGVIALGRRQAKHGMHKIPEYHVWVSLRGRCSNPLDANYHHYGGRGIRVCERWSEFAVFIEDMGRRPGLGYSIERKDNSLGYGPDNCVWATHAEQARNRRNTRLLTCDGRTACASDWAAEVGMSLPTLYSRLRKGWSHESAIKTPIDERQRRV